MSYRLSAHDKNMGRARRRAPHSSSSPSRSRSRSLSPRRMRFSFRSTDRDRDVDRRRKSPPSRDHDWDGRRSEWNRGERGRGDEDRYGHGGSRSGFTMGPSGLEARGYAGGGSRAGGSSDQCYVCGGYGHWARNCSSKTSLYRAGTGSRAYSPPSSRAAEPPKCFECGKFGHVARECTLRQTGAVEQRCYECNSIGHIARECPAKGRGRFAPAPQLAPRERMSFPGPPRGGSSSEGCYHCGQPGHFARECPQKGGGAPPLPSMDRWMGGMMGGLGGPAGLAAFNHGLAMMSGMGAIIPGPGGGCYECGQPGHFARECNARRQRLSTKGISGMGRDSSRRVSGEVKLDTDLDTYMKEKRDRARQGHRSSGSEDEENGNHELSGDGGNRSSEDRNADNEVQSEDLEREKASEDEKDQPADVVELADTLIESNGQAEAEGNGDGERKGGGEDAVEPELKDD